MQKMKSYKDQNTGFFFRKTLWSVLLKVHMYGCLGLFFLVCSLYSMYVNKLFAHNEFFFCLFDCMYFNGICLFCPFLLYTAFVMNIVKSIRWTPMRVRKYYMFCVLMQNISALIGWLAVVVVAMLTRVAEKEPHVWYLRINVKQRRCGIRLDQGNREKEAPLEWMEETKCIFVIHNVYCIWYTNTNTVNKVCAATIWSPERWVTKCYSPY